MTRQRQWVNNRIATTTTELSKIEYRNVKYIYLVQTEYKQMSKIYKNNNVYFGSICSSERSTKVKRNTKLSLSKTEI
jgi:hypothetical protein